MNYLKIIQTNLYLWRLFHDISTIHHRQIYEDNSMIHHRYIYEDNSDKIYLNYLNIIQTNLYRVILIFKKNNNNYNNNYWSWLFNITFDMMFNDVCKTDFSFRVIHFWFNILFYVHPKHVFGRKFYYIFPFGVCMLMYVYVCNVIA